MRLLEEAGLPPGVINMVTGDGIAVSEVALADPDLAGIHFTGSTPVFQHLWRQVGENIASYRSYPRIVGETGGKDFVVAHPSRRRRRAAYGAGPRRVRVPGPEVLGRLARLRAAQHLDAGCATRSPPRPTRSRWATSPTCRNFMGAVIDERAFAKHKTALDRAQGDDTHHRRSPAARATTARAGSCARRCCESTDPTNEIFTTEYFGPILGVHVYDDADYDAMLTQMESVAPYALTGAVIAQDRAAIAARQRRRCASPPATSTSTTSPPAPSSVSSRSAAPARAAPTTRPARRRTCCAGPAPRSIKETFVPPTDYRYPHMG